MLVYLRCFILASGILHIEPFAPTRIHHFTYACIHPYIYIFRYCNGEIRVKHVTFPPPPSFLSFAEPLISEFVKKFVIRSSSSVCTFAHTDFFSTLSFRRAIVPLIVGQAQILFHRIHVAFSLPKSQKITYKLCIAE